MARVTENGSRFYIIAGRSLVLDGKYTVFGTVAEDLDHVLEKFNGVICDQQGRPRWTFDQAYIHSPQPV